MHPGARGVHTLLFFVIFVFVSTASAIQPTNNFTIFSNNTNLKFTGDWSHLEGATCGDDALWAISSTAGNSMSLHFIGATGLTLYGSSDSDSARIHIQIDDVSSDLDLSAVGGGPTNQCFPIFTISNIDQSASHVLTASHSGSGVNTGSGTGSFAISHITLQQTGSQFNTSTTTTLSEAVPSATYSSTSTSKPSTLSAPKVSNPVNLPHGDSKGGLITGIIFGSIFSILIICGGLFLSRRQGWLFWKRKERRLSLSKGISSDILFAGEAPNKPPDGISKMTQPPFDKGPSFDESPNKISGGQASHTFVGKGIEQPHVDGQDIVVPSLTKDRTPSPVIVIEDYNSLRRIQSAPNNGPLKSSKEAGTSKSFIAHDPHSNTRRSKFSTRPGLDSSSVSFKFDTKNGGRSHEDSIRSGRASPVSIAPSWRTEDIRYSGVTVKMATREVLRVEQPQFNFSWNQSSVLENGESARQQKDP